MHNSFQSLRDYLRAAFRRKWAFLIPLAAGIALAAVVWSRTTPKYRASATVRRQDLSVAQTTPGYAAGGKAAGISVPALRAEMLTWTSLRKVIRQTNLDPALETQADWQRMYEKLRGAISIETTAEGPGIQIIEIAAVHEEPELAKEIANAVADNYVEKAKKENRSDTELAVQFLQKQTDEYHQKLLQAERNLEEYKEEHYTDVPAVRENILNQLMSLRTEKAATETALAEAKSELEKVKKQLKEVPKVVDGETVMKKNPAYANLESELNKLKRNRRQMLARYTKKHPDVKEIERQIADVEKELEETPERVEGSTTQIVNPQYEELQIRRRELEQKIRGREVALTEVETRISTHQKRLEDIVAEEKRYNELQRERNEYERQYQRYREQLVSARTRMEVEGGQYGAQVEMAARALTPTFPYSAPWIRYIALCMLAGAAAGGALVVGLEFADRSFRSVEDAEAYLGVQVLGSVPTILTSEEKTRKRRRKIIAGGAALLAIVVGGAACAWLMYPDLVRDVAMQVQGRIIELTSRVQ